MIESKSWLKLLMIVSSFLAGMGSAHVRNDIGDHEGAMELLSTHRKLMTGKCADTSGDAPPDRIFSPAPERQSNPDLVATCGNIKVILILDASSSICDSSRTDNSPSNQCNTPDEATQVRSGATAIVNALAGTGAKVAIVEFGTFAIQQDYIFVDAAGTARLLDFITAYKHEEVKDLSESYIYTNWDAAFHKANDLNDRYGPADLVIFFTDGNPTAYDNDYANDTGPSPVSTGSGVNQNGRASVYRAMEEANCLKQDGSHILMVGVGNGVTTSNLISVSDEDSVTGSDFDILTSDVLTTGAFQELTTSLRSIAFQLCSPSVTITKYLSGAGRQSGISFAAQLGGTDYAWQTPIVEVGPIDAVGVTSTFGTLTFQWKNGTPNVQRTITISEQAPDFAISSLSCSQETIASATPVDVTPAFTNSLFVLTVPAEAIVTCDVIDSLDTSPRLGSESPSGSHTPSSSVGPSAIPSNIPSLSLDPSAMPTEQPTTSMSPSSSPSDIPSASNNPSTTTSSTPSLSNDPSQSPSDVPTLSIAPSSSPSDLPTVSIAPSSSPSDMPSISMVPSASPSEIPSTSIVPSSSPSNRPSTSIVPSSSPSDMPSISIVPSSSPSDMPSTSFSPTESASNRPTQSSVPSMRATLTPSVSIKPSTSPSALPSTSGEPSVVASETPSASLDPTGMPTGHPTTSNSPSSRPSPAPSQSNDPSSRPSNFPTVSLAPTGTPSSLPTVSTAPSVRLTSTPSVSPEPTASPSTRPSRSVPSDGPSLIPSLRIDPSSSPTEQQTEHPSTLPSASIEPSMVPSPLIVNSTSSSPPSVSTSPSTFMRQSQPSMLSMSLSMKVAIARTIAARATTGGKAGRKKAIFKKLRGPRRKGP